MAHQLVNFPHAPANGNVQTPPTVEQVLGVLFEVVPHMTMESQASFISMFRDNAPGLPSRGAPKAPSRRAHLSLLPDSLHNYVQEKAVQHLFESDLAFEAKQQATAKPPKRSGNSMDITKRYGKPQQRRVRRKLGSRNYLSPGEPPHRDVWVHGITKALPCP